jgi:hypothetical protein
MTTHRTGRPHKTSAMSTLQPYDRCCIEWDCWTRDGKRLIKCGAIVMFMHVLEDDSTWAKCLISSQSSVVSSQSSRLRTPDSGLRTPDSGLRTPDSVILPVAALSEPAHEPERDPE